MQGHALSGWLQRAERAIVGAFGGELDMVNETRDFPMPTLLAPGPERMLERAKADGLMVPMERIQGSCVWRNAKQPYASSLEHR